MFWDWSSAEYELLPLLLVCDFWKEMFHKGAYARGCDACNGEASAQRKIGTSLSFIFLRRAVGDGVENRIRFLRGCWTHRWKAWGTARRNTRDDARIRRISLRVRRLTR
jgi:hypothetical protein